MNKHPLEIDTETLAFTMIGLVGYRDLCANAPMVSEKFRERLNAAIRFYQNDLSPEAQKAMTERLREILLFGV